MTRRIEVDLPVRLMESLLPKDIGATVAGDLREEYVERRQSATPIQALSWLLSQIVMSVPRLILSEFRQWRWLPALLAAVVMFLVLAKIEPLLHHWLAQSLQMSIGQYMIIALLIGLAACLCGGFLATWIYRGSAFFYSVITTSAMVIVTLTVEMDEPAWYSAGFIVIALLAPIVGGAGFIALSERFRVDRSTYDG